MFNSARGFSFMTFKDWVTCLIKLKTRINEQFLYIENCDWHTSDLKSHLQKQYVDFSDIKMM